MACGTVAPQTDIKPPPHALEGDVLTIGQPGKALIQSRFFIHEEQKLSYLK